MTMKEVLIQGCTLLSGRDEEIPMNELHMLILLMYAVKHVKKRVTIAPLQLLTNDAMLHLKEVVSKECHLWTETLKVE